MSEVTPHSVMEKYEFYFLGLTFTLLGATTQTANFSEYSQLNSIIELTGWFLLGVSGVVGLSKIEHLSSLISIHNEKESSIDYSNSLQKAKVKGTKQVHYAQTGEYVEIDKVIAILEKNKDTWHDRLETFGKWHDIKHIVQKYSFLVALVVLAISRSFIVFFPTICSS